MLIDFLKVFSLSQILSTLQFFSRLNAGRTYVAYILNTTAFFGHKLLISQRYSHLKLRRQNKSIYFKTGKYHVQLAQLNIFLNNLHILILTEENKLTLCLRFVLILKLFCFVPFREKWFELQNTRSLSNKLVSDKTGPYINSVYKSSKTDFKPIWLTNGIAFLSFFSEIWRTVNCVSLEKTYF